MKRGFTLVEVLITLAVVGIVAALTIPNLVKNYQKRVFVSQLERVYNQISNAAKRLMADESVESLTETYLVASSTGLNENGDREYSDQDFANAQGKFLNTYFKVARDCGNKNPEGCIADEYFTLDRSVSGHLSTSNYMYCVTLNTGAALCMAPMNFIARDVSSFALIYVDVNGKAGPNIDGRDLFTLMLYPGGQIKGHWPGANYKQNLEYCGKWLGSYGCLDKIMSNGWAMDY